LSPHILAVRDGTNFPLELAQAEETVGNE